MREDCKAIRDELALSGGTLESDAVREHLTECPDCARVRAQLAEIEQGLASLSTHDVEDRVVEKLLERPELHRVRPRLSPFAWGLGLAAAAVIVLVVTSLLPVRYRKEPEISTLGNRDEFRRQLQVGPFTESSEENVAADRASGASPAPEVDKLDNQGRAFRNWVAPEVELKDDEKNVVTGPRSDAPATTPPPPPPPARDAVGQSSIVSNEPAVGGKREGEKTKESEEQFGAYAAAPAEEGLLSRQLRENVPKKQTHRDPLYPELAKQARVGGTVVLKITVDPEGNVTDVKVVRSIPLLDQAAIDAVREWKYAPSDEDAPRTFPVSVSFELTDEPEKLDVEEAALSFLAERARVEGLRFQDASGYWRNTYVPGDPRIRQLQARLRRHTLDVSGQATPMLHRAARPIARPFDAPEKAALSLYVHAETRGLTKRSRLLVQVGLRAQEDHGRRRPPMNVGVVLDATKPFTDEMASVVRATLEALARAKEPGDRFRLVVAGAGGGELVAPQGFTHGAVRVAFMDVLAGSKESASLDRVEAVRLAMKRVHAGDDPTMPLGTSLVLFVTPGPVGEDLAALEKMAHRSAVGGVPLSVLALGANGDGDQIEQLVLAGQGRRHFVERTSDAAPAVERELAATSRAVARAVRLRIKLAQGVELVDVVGSEPLTGRQAERVREAERSIDLRLSRNLGIEADRGEDEDGIQMVIPSFYAGDAHTILLDVVASGPGPIAEVTARYKDLAQLENTVGRASLSLPRSDAPPGPLETNVLKDFLTWRVSRTLGTAAEALERGDSARASAVLRETRDLLEGLGFGADRDLARDIAMLEEYRSYIPKWRSAYLLSYLMDSLRYAGLLKRHRPPSLS